MFPSVITYRSGVVGKESVEGWGTRQLPALPALSLPHVHRCCCCPTRPWSRGEKEEVCPSSPEQFNANVLPLAGHTLSFSPWAFPALYFSDSQAAFIFLGSSRVRLGQAGSRGSVLGPRCVRHQMSRHFYCSISMPPWKWVRPLR